MEEIVKSKLKRLLKGKHKNIYHDIYVNLLADPNCYKTGKGINLNNEDSYNLINLSSKKIYIALESTGVCEINGM